MSFLEKYLSKNNFKFLIFNFRANKNLTFKPIRLYAGALKRGNTVITMSYSREFLRPTAAIFSLLT